MNHSQTKLMFLYSRRLIRSRNHWIPGTFQHDNAIELSAGTARLNRTRRNLVNMFYTPKFLADLDSFMHKYGSYILSEAMSISDPNDWTAHFVKLCRMVQKKTILPGEAEIAMNISLEDLDEMNLLAWQSEKCLKINQSFSEALAKANQIAKTHQHCLYQSRHFCNTIVNISYPPDTLNPWLGNALRLFDAVVSETMRIQK
jgi:hypothetical protein